MVVSGRAMTPSERELIRRLREGDDDAYAEVHRLYAKRIRALHLRRFHDAALADELTQETFIKLYSSFCLVRSDCDSLGGLLTKTAVNVANDHEKRENRREQHLCDYAEWVGSEPTAPAADAEHNGREIIDVVLKAAATTLSPKLYEVVLLWLIGENTAEEVAAIMRLKVAAVQKRIQRASVPLAAGLRTYLKGKPHEMDGRASAGRAGESAPRPAGRVLR
jgi:RNA polymerase sigma-70 factor (ECF subfamily)